MRKNNKNINLELGNRFPLRKVFAQLLTILILLQTIVPPSFAASGVPNSFLLAKRLFATSSSDNGNNSSNVSNHPPISNVFNDKNLINQNKIDSKQNVFLNTKFSIKKNIKSNTKENSKLNIDPNITQSNQANNELNLQPNPQQGTVFNNFVNSNITNQANGISNYVSKNNRINNINSISNLSRTNNNLVTTNRNNINNNPNILNKKLAFLPTALQEAGEVAVVRHGPSLNGGRAEGSIRVLLGEQTNINAGTTITGDLLVPGSPNININGNIKYNGTIVGIGSANPTNYGININNGTNLRHIVTHTNPISMPIVTPPANPTGTRNVTLSNGQSPGDFATILNLTLHPNYGALLAVPPGTYGQFIANNNTGFIFGIEGENTTYNLQDLVLNSSTQLQVLGNVTINIKNQINLNSQTTVGNQLSPVSLSINISNGGMNLNSQSKLYGVLTAPNGTVNINANSLVKGLVICDRLHLNANGLLQGLFADTISPVVTITQPSNGATLTTQQVTVTGTFDDDSVVTLVKVNGVTASITNQTFTASIPLTLGSNTITAIATDIFGNNGQTSITVTLSDGTNQPPQVNAGTDQTITLPSTASLSATAVDDGLPSPPGQLTYLWSKVSGPGTVSFSNSTSLNTTVSFSVTGTYNLRITASDSQLTASDDIVITVNPEAQQNQPPQVNAGNDQSINLPNVANLSATATDDGLPNPPAQLTFTWSKVSGPGTVNFSNTNSLTTTASFSEIGNYTLRITVSDSELTSSDDIVITVNAQPVENQAPQVNAGNDQTITLPNSATLNGVVTDDGLPNPPSELTISWSKVSGPGTVTFTSQNTAITQASFSLAGTYVLRLSASDSILIGSDEVEIIVNSPQNQSPQVNAGNDQTITLPSSVTLNGAVTDDGLPNPPSELIISWSKLSGPGTVTFSSQNTVTTQASFSLAGTYVLRLSASDSQLVGSDEVTITVNEQPVQNQAPQVNAGVDQSITLPSAVSLAGTVTDDGLPSPPAQTTVTWSKVSGPGTVSFSNANSLTTTASFSEAGTYVIRLSADDSELTASDELTVVVSPQPPQNQAPQVNAGNDQSITLPNVANLVGTVTDDGLPSPPAQTTVTWSKVSGSGNVTFVTPNSLTTTASFSESGTYVIRLSATDSELTASDELTVVVSPQPPQNQAPQVNAGTNQTINLSENLIKNPSNESELVNGEIANWTQVTGSGWTQAVAGSNGLPSALQGNTYFTAGNSANAELSQDIDVSAFASQIANATQLFEFRGYVRSKGETPSDTARIVVEYRNATDLLASYDSGLGGSVNNWQLVRDLRNAPVGTTIIRIRLIASLNSGTSNDAYFDYLSLRTANLASTQLNGIASDDGLPVGSSLTTNWTKISGPGNVVFSDENSVSSNVTFDQVGEYVLRLTASDSVLTSSSDITITVVNNNVGAVVNAGDDQTIILPNTASLSGSYLDDGLPVGANITTTWSKIDGTGNVSFTDANNLATTVTFTEAGIYTLRLSVNDSVVTMADDIIITVEPEPIQNTPPQVNAGNDQSITLPNVANLVGTVTDDGLPSPPAQTTVTWSKVSGPGTVTFSDSNNLTSTASFSESGTYVIRLSATDSELSASDDIEITVNPAAPNQAPIVNAGQDQTITLPNTANLVATVTDDGLPNNTLIINWTTVSGPCQATFANANQLATIVSLTLPGVYVLRLSVSDGEFTVTDELTITVLAGNRSNLAPIVNAGENQTISVNSTTLEGSVKDDGLPLNSILDVKWTKVSGNGTVVFSNDKSPTTNITFSGGGTYVLRLTVNDSLLTTTSDITIINNTPANQPPIVDPGTYPALIVPYGPNLIRNAGNEGQVVSGIPEGWIIQFGQASWTKGISPTPIEGSSYFVNTDGGIYQDIDVSIYNQAIAAGTQRFALNGYIRGSDIGKSGRITIRYLNATNTTLASYETGIVNPANWTLYTDVRTAPTSTTKIRIELYSNGGYIDGLSLRALLGTQDIPSLQLNGVITDDGLPNPPSKVVFLWDLVPGFSFPLLSSNKILNPTASFTNLGTYKLRLLASDDELVSSSDATITLKNIDNVNNVTVNAGDDQTLVVPYGPNVIRNAGNEGQIVGNIPEGWISILGANPWTKATTPTPIEGSASFTNTFGGIAQDIDVSIYNQAIAAGTQKFALNGYIRGNDTGKTGRIVIRYFNATNNQLATYDTGPVSPANWTLYTDVRTAPVGTVRIRIEIYSDGAYVDALSLRALLSTANLPSVSLTGSVLESGNPVDDRLYIQWSKISGPGTVSFSAPNSVNTNVSFTDVGTYVLRLVASDLAFSLSDEVTITLKNIDNVNNVTVNAGDDQTLVVPYGPNLIRNAGNEGQIINGIPEGWTNLFGQANWTKATTPTPIEGSASFTNTFGGIYQDIDLSIYEQSILAGTQKFALNAYLRGNGTGTTVRVVTHYRNSSGANISSFDTGTISPSNWTLISDVRTIPSTARSVRVEIHSTNAFVDALSLRALLSTANLPSVNLTGSVLENANPVDDRLYIQWSKISGPGSVSFSAPNSVNSSASFTDVGTYVLRLTASDLGFSLSDELTITLKNIDNVNNVTVNAGDDQNVTAFLSNNLVNNPSNEGQVISGIPEGWTNLFGQANWTKATTPTPIEGSASFTNTFGGIYQDIDLSIYEQSIVAGTQKFALNAYLRGNGTGTTVRVVTHYRNSSGANISSFDTGGISPSNWTLISDVRTVPVGTRSVRVEIHSTNAFVDALSLRALLTSNLPSTTLTGSVLESGNPVDDRLYIQWSKISGPGSVTFSAPNKVNTTASFTDVGTYTLRLTASDLAFSLSDDVVIILNAGVPAQNQAPQVNAGANQSISLQGNLTQNGGNESELVNGEIPSWQEVSGNWTQAVAGSNGLPSAYEGNTCFISSDSANAELTQTIDVSNFASTIAGQTQEFALRVLVRSGDENPIDTAKVVIEYLNSTNTPIAGLDIDVTPTSSSWTEVTDQSLAPVGTASIRIKLIAIRNSGTTTDVYFDAVSFRPVGNTATLLSGTATDDGLPIGSSLTVNWTKVSGPGNVVFSTPNQAITSAIFDEVGTYVLRLSASDSVLSSDSDITITVTSNNVAPSVNAGDDQTITLPSNASLSGSISDDGLPLGANVTTTWSKVSGSGTVTFSNPNELNTTATFSEAGTYVLALTATDTEFNTSDEITIVVNPAPVQNQAPTVNAGQDQTITLPNTASLVATATDDGLPSPPAQLTFTWTKVSGPGTVNFATPNSLTTTATFDTAGSYTLRITVSDSALSASDDVIVNVNAQGQQNQAPVVNAGQDQTLAIIEIATLTGTATDDGLPPGSSLFYLWEKVSGPGTVGFNAPNSLQTQAQFSAEGIYVLRLSVSDSQFTTTDEVQITVVTPNVPAAEVTIHTPTDGTTITNLTDVVATITYTGTSINWVLDYSLNPNDDLDLTRSYTTIATGNTTVTNSTIATFDPTVMLNGNYLLRLTATDNFGRSVNTVVTVIVDKNLKVGNFTLSFTDLAVPVAGIPITVIRTYDSRDKRKGDFGVGWTLDVKNIRLEKSSSLGKHWIETLDQEGPTFRYRLIQTRSKFVTITFPDGKVFKFKAVPNPNSQIAAIVNLNGMNFVPEPGTFGTLVALEEQELRVEGDVPQVPPGAGVVQIINLQGNTPGQPFNPRLFKLTTLEGAEFIIDEFNGLQSITDLNGNSLTVNNNGLVHSSGKSITFTRDGQGRITQITDPSGNTQTYTYDTAGDLVSHRDMENNVTSFGYDNNHYLLDITDPRGIKPIRNEYDDDGRLLKHTDAFNKEIVYTHQIGARTEVIADRLGNVTTFEYDNSGNVLKKIDALGNLTTYTYDGNDNQLTETNALGKTTTSTYDQFDNLLTQTDPLNNTSTYTYNTRRQVLTITDPKGNVTTNTYDNKGNLTSTKDALNNTSSYTYNPFGLVLTQTDALGHVTTYQYSGSQPSQITDAQGNISSFTYDTNGNQLTQTVTRTVSGSPQTITSTNTYDKLNRLTKVTYPDSSETHTSYNAIGKVASSTDQLGRSTSYNYDSMGQLLSTTFADGTSTSSSYDAEGRRLTSTDQLGRVTSFQYDVLGRLTKTTAPDNSFTTTVYDSIGRVTSTIDQLGHSTSYEYDANCGCSGRRSKIIDALGNQTSFAYDQNGNQISFTDARGNTTTTTYDQLNRQTRTTFPDGTFQEVTYDQLGRRVAARDQAGSTNQFFYDSLGRLIKVKDALNHETQYGYDELGQQITQIDAKGRTTRYEYDQLGRRIKRTLPMGQFETYSYDLGGRLTSRRDFNNKVTAFAYDQLNRLLSKTPDASFNQAPITFTYNSLGQRLTMTDASGTITYSYDNRNRLISKATPQGTLTYTYNAVGNIITVRSSNAEGVSVDYAYDNLNRLQTVTDNNLANGQNQTSYGYDQVGNLQTVTLPNQVETTYQYNNLNRLTNVATAKLGTLIASYAYSLGAAGNRLSVSELSGRVVNYTYDSIYRLTSETITGNTNPVLNGSVSYAYDEVGNRLSRTSTLAAVPSQQNITTDPNDRLISDSYDDNGSTTVADGKNYSYDFENRIIGVTGNGIAISIKYDGDGNRVEKSVTQNSQTVTTKYLVDTNNLTGYAQVVEEVQDSVVTRQYTYGLDLISQRQIIGNDRISSFYQYDGHGSVRGLTDSNGVLTDSFTYDSYGTLIEHTGSTPTNYLYAGEQFDHDLGMYFLRARYLDVNKGRFCSQDSYEGRKDEPGSLHKYLYTNNDPINKKDPSGNMTLVDFQAALQAQLVTVAQFTQVALRVYYTTSSAIDTLNAAYGLAEVVFSGSLQGIIEDHLKNALSNQLKITYSSIINSLSQNMPQIISTGLSQWGPAFFKSYVQKKNKIEKFMIYLPQPIPQPIPFTELPLTLSFKGLRIGFIIGGPGTQIIGAGVKMSNGQTQQLWRMDLGGLFPYHGNPLGTGAKPKANELDLWEDRQGITTFHYHVLKF